MNELQRQTYLSVLGIENYMPRWNLPCAPLSVACALPEVEIKNNQIVSQFASATNSLLDVPTVVSPTIKPLVAIDKLIDLDVRQKVVTPVNAASILKQFEEKKLSIVAPFSLSVWRPLPGFLIVDSRNTTLALPTELLLNNILTAVTGTVKREVKEEVLHWPMIENRFVSRTELDARNELQTWLAVENELRPINRLWLLGENASKYFVSENVSVIDCCWKKITIDMVGQESVTALLLPSLIELLQKPLNKARLWVTLE